MQAAVSYGIDSPPTATYSDSCCSIFTKYSRNHKGTDHLQRFTPDANGVYKESPCLMVKVSGIGYSIDSKGAIKFEQHYIVPHI